MAENITVRTDFVGSLQCDVCGSEFSETYLFLICKWDTESEEYYLSRILCNTHAELGEI